MRKLITIITLALIALTASAQADRHEVRQGNRLFKAGKFEAADISYRKAQLKDSTSFAAGYNLANALYREGNYDEAGKQLSKLSSKAKGRQDEASFWFNAGDVAIQKKDWKTAVDAFHASLLLNPSDIDAKENYLYAKKMLEDQQQQEQNQQDQNQDQNQDQQQQQQQQQDQQQDQNQDQNQDQQDQQEQPQEQQPQDQQITPQQAQQMLQAIEAKEKETQDKVNKEKALMLKSRQKEKNW